MDGESCYFYEVNSTLLKTLVGEKIENFISLPYNQAVVKVGPIVSEVMYYSNLSIGALVTGVYIEDISCNSYDICLRLAGGNILRVYKFYDYYMENSRLAELEFNHGEVLATF